MNKGVEIVLARMDSNPEEFYQGSDKWKFIYTEYFRDAMTEAEKGMIFDKLKVIRNEEFTRKVITTLLPPDRKESDFGKAPMMAEGRAVRFNASDAQMATQLGMSPSEYVKYKKDAGL
jgi:hypothetical protein